jgi:tetratricopeptide (TPR) repeat protein
MERALALNGVLGGNEVEVVHANNLEVLGRMSQERGNSAAAANYLMRALAINEEIESQVGQAANLNNLGLITGKSDPQRAEEYLRRSLAITEGGLNGECVRVEYWPVASAAVDSAPNSARTIDVPVEYLAEYKLDPDKGLRRLLALRKLSADAHGNLAVLAREGGDLAAAEREFLRLLEVHKDLEDKSGMAADLDNLAMISQTHRHLSAACTAWTRSMTIYGEIGWAKAAEVISAKMRAAGCRNGGL